MEDKLCLCSVLMSVQFNRCGREGGVVLYNAVCLVVKHTAERDMVKIMEKLFDSDDELATCVNIFLAVV